MPFLFRAGFKSPPLVAGLIGFLEQIHIPVLHYYSWCRCVLETSTFHHQQSADKQRQFKKNIQEVKSSKLIKML